MKEYTRNSPFKGRRARQRWLREFMKRRSAPRFGRRPGRPNELIVESEGHLNRMSEEKNKGTCRVFFQNIGTLPLGSARHEAEEAIGVLDKTGVDIAGLTECNRNEKNAYVRRECGLMMRRVMKGAYSKMGSNTQYEVSGQRKQGGIMTILSRRTKNMGEVEVDQLGRWSRVHLTGQKGEWVIYTLYVPSDVDLGGPATIRRKLQHAADREDRVIHWKKQFYEDLAQEVERDKEQGREVLVGGDFNESMEKGRVMKEEMRGLGLINIFHEKMEKVPPTRTPGRYAIDHLWCTEGVYRSIDKCGLVPRCGVFTSDHLGLFVDIRIDGIPQATKPEEVQRRFLKSGNKRSREKYLEYVLRRFEEEDIYKRAEELEESERKGLDDEIIEEGLNRLDTEIQEIMMMGEKMLAPSRVDTFSIELKMYKKERKYWRKIRKGKNLTHSVLKKLWEGHREGNWNMSDRDMRVRLRGVDMKIKEYYGRREERREKYLEDLAEEYKGKGQKATGAIIEEINKKEKRRKEYNKLRNEMKEGRQVTEAEVKVPKGMTSVGKMWEAIKESEKEPEEWERVTGQREVEEIMVPWCAEHFSQAGKTPFASGKWEEVLDIFDENSEVRKILDGNYNEANNEPKWMKQWIMEMKRKQGVTGQVELRTTFGEFEKFVNGVVESKSSSPSGRHYGHYKVAATNERFLRVLYKVMEIAMRRGVVLRRWEKVLQVLLLKDPPDVKIHRFRNITLVEADLMFIMKIVWAKGLGDRIENDGTLNGSQYARRGQVAQTSILNKRMSYDLQYVMRMPSFQADNDAVNCYDRIVVNIAAIAAMRMGLGEEAAKFLVKTLRKFKHSIRLGGKPSEREFCDSLRKRIHGTGQGTGWSPVLWSVVDDVIITLMEKFQPGQIFSSPDGKLNAVQMLDAFVDDSNLSVNQKGVVEYNKAWGTKHGLEEAGLQAFQEYSWYLSGSGGKLGMPKCRFYWLDFARQKTRYVFKKKKKMQIMVEVDGSGRKTELKQLDAREEHKILGVWLSPQGRNKEQKRFLEKKVRTWCEKVEGGSLPPYLRIESYRNRLCPQVGYSLGITQLTETECKKTMQPVEQVLRRANYLSRSFSTAVLRLPEKYGGYGSMDIWKKAICDQGKMIINALRSEDNTGAKVRILLETQQLESGSSKSILGKEYEGRLKYLTNTWLVRAVMRLAGSGLRVNTDHWIPGMGRTKTVMDMLHERGIRGDEYEAMNLCRMKLGVIFADDLYDIRGKLRDEESLRWEGSKSTLEWPRTEVPGTWMRKWFEVVREIFPNVTRTLTWRHRKGTVKTSEDKSVVRIDEEWYERAGNGRGTEYRRTEPRERMEMRDCEVFRKGMRMWVKVGLTPVIESTEEEARQRKGVQLGSHQIATVRRILKRGTLVGACDGSVKGGAKAVSVWLGDRETEEGIMISEEVEGLPHDSGRAELAGPLIALKILTEIERNYGEVGHVVLWSDSKETIQTNRKSKVAKLPSRACKRNVDMRLQLERLKKEYGGYLEMQKVKAHQDDNKVYEELAFEERRNVDCDGAANDKAGRAKIRRYVSTLEPGVEAMLWTDQGGLTEEPYDWLMEREAKTEICRRLKISGRVYGIISWEICGKVLEKIQPRYRPSVKKLIWEEVPTRVKLVKYGFEGNERCPLCGGRDDVRHFGMCTGGNLGHERGRIIGNMKSKLNEVGVNPFLVTWFLQALNGETPVWEKVSPLGLHQVAKRTYEDQSTIGWGHLLRGRVPESMVSLQDKWSKEFGEQKNKKKDPRAVVEKALAHGLLAVYEVWKARCDEVAKVEIPTKKKVKLEAIRELSGERDQVEARDRFLFDDDKIPGPERSVQEMNDWIECIRKSKERMQRRSLSRTRRIGK